MPPSLPAGLSRPPSLPLSCPRPRLLPPASPPVEVAAVLLQHGPYAVIKVVQHQQQLRQRLIQGLLILNAKLLTWCSTHTAAASRSL